MTTLPLAFTKPPLSLNDRMPEGAVRFTVDGPPITKARARVVRRGSKVVSYTPEQTRTAEDRVRAAFLKVARPKHRGDAEHTFGVIAIFHMPPGGNRKDVDNLLKLILDALNKVAWVDDAQVSEVFGRKLPEATSPRTEVVIYQTGEANPPTFGTCQHCGEQFPKPYSHSRKMFCSQVCRSDALRARRVRTCERCGDEFIADRAGDGTRHCSADCAYRAKHIEVTCAGCGERFTKARSTARRGNSYCSPECQRTYWRARKAEGAAKGQCQHCGGPTSKPSYTRCRSCFYARQP